VAEQWLVLKFGGTSVAGRRQWETIASVVKARRSEGYRVLLVCSAVAGVTNLLWALAEQPDSESLLSDILDIHRTLSQQLEVDVDHWLAEAEDHIRHCLQQIASASGPDWNAALLATGEYLSTRIGLRFLQQRVAVDWVDACDVL